ncbi:MAG: class I SAM-dependent methyltransferase [Bacteroidota bacterium]
MEYDPIKKVIGDVVGTNVFLRILFYKALGLLFLREWHVKRALRRVFRNRSVTHVFDAGSGFGQYSYFLAKKYPEVRIHAVDVKEDQIADCRRFFTKAGIANVHFQVEDLTVPLHDGEFDLALSVDVMEHIPDDVRVFGNLFRALKPGGVLLVNTPSNLGGSDVAHEGEAGFIGEHARTGYGADEIRSKLEGAGFRIDHLSYTYGRWGTIAWRIGIKVPMKMLGASKLFFVLLPVYYLVTFPMTLLLMAADYWSENVRGTGLLVVAAKPPSL